MRRLTVLVVLLALGGSLTLVACGAQPTTVMCFGPRPVSSVHPVGSRISFSMTTVHGTVTYSVPKTAFGGAPAAMKNGDIIAFCAETVDSGGQSTTTITQFSDQANLPLPTRRSLARQVTADGRMLGKRREGKRSFLSPGGTSHSAVCWVWHMTY